jgi:hypothetical protein
MMMMMMMMMTTTTMMMMMMMMRMMMMPQVVGVADTGLDYFSCFFYDSKNPVSFKTQVIKRPWK